MADPVTAPQTAAPPAGAAARMRPATQGRAARLLPSFVSLTLHGTLLLFLSLVYIVTLGHREQAVAIDIVERTGESAPDLVSLEDSGAKASDPANERPALRQAPAPPTNELLPRLWADDGANPAAVAAFSDSPSLPISPEELGVDASPIAGAEAFAGGVVSDEAAMVPGADRPPVPPIYTARIGEGKQEALKRHGGNAATEAAVLLSLRWLAAKQDRKGFWRAGDGMVYDRHPVVAPPQMPASEFQAIQTPPADQTDEAALRAWYLRRQQALARWSAVYDRWLEDNPDRSAAAAVTGLSLLAFQGAGHTEASGEFSETVRRGLYWLESIQGPDGAFAEFTYGQAMATLAIAEAQVMGRDRTEVLRKAVAEIVRRQSATGGWDYYGRTPKERSDTSITCWCVMALKSAKAAGVEAPGDPIGKAMGYFRRAGIDSPDQFGVAYAIAANPPTRQAFAGRSHGRTHGLFGMTLSTLRFLDLPRDHPFLRRGTDILSKLGPPEGDVYALYYGTLALYQEGGEPWKRWNAAMQKLLLGLQEKAGADRGSFSEQICIYGPRYGGRVYTTAMAALCLEVYYRYLPVYETLEPPAVVTPDPPRLPAAGLSELAREAEAEESRGEVSVALAIWRRILEVGGSTPEGALARDAIRRLEGRENTAALLRFAKNAVQNGAPELARGYLNRLLATSKDEAIRKEAKDLIARLPAPPEAPAGGGTAEPPAPKEPELPPPPPSREEIQRLRDRIARFEREQAGALRALRRDVLDRVAASSGKHSEAFLDPYRKVLALYDQAGIPSAGAGTFEAFYLTEAARRVFGANQALERDLHREEYRYILLLNDYRMRLGLGPLRIDPKLVAASRKHGEEMERMNYFAHESPVEANRTPWMRAKAEGTTAHGEVLFYGRPDAASALSAWQLSPGHHKILVMNADRVGVGRHGTFWTSMEGNDRMAAFERMAMRPQAPVRVPVPAR